MTSPTQRTLKYYRDQNFRCQIVERWNPWSKTRQDLFGCIDIVCIGNGKTYGIQATSGNNTPARVEKMKKSEAYAELKKAGWQMIVIGWRKLRVKGTKKQTKWQPKIIIN